MHRLLWFVTLLAVLAGCNLDSNNTDSTPVSATETPSPDSATPLPGDLVIYLATPEGDPGPIGPIGCGNYLVPVTRGPLPPTTTDRQIATALTDLFSIKDQFYGESGLMNALYQSNLVVQSVTLDDSGNATVDLTGDYLLSGVCSDAIFRAQIEETARQFSAASVAVFINGTPLADVVSGRGQ